MGENAESAFWLEEYSGKPVTPFSLKRKVKSKKLNFVGWGSEPLIEFLESIGKDTSKQISQHDVADIIVKYVNESNLINPAKKKRIVCDERLHSIFGRKTISRNKVYDLLETHYAENQDLDEDFFFSSEEENLGVEQKSEIPQKKTYQKKKVLETPKGCFAKIVPDNIKLVYLKRSLVQDLLKDFESFEAKVVGSFVRIKSDPNDYLQKNSHQLVLVKGLMKASGKNDINADIRLKVSSYVKDVSISMLSDDNFSEEECTDLHQRVENGLLKRPTVVELEVKAQSLHADITKHWIATELTLLGKLMERANEKGWRREWFEYMERKELLQTPKEESRLLLEVPNVIADEIEPETPPQGFLDDKHKNDSSAISSLKGTSEFPSDTVLNGKLSTLMPSPTAVQSSLAISKDDTDTLVQPSAISKDNTDMSVQVQSSSTISKDNTDNSRDVHEQLKQPSDNNDQSALLVNIPENDGGHIEKQSFVNKSSTQVVIDLSDDDEEQEDSNEVQGQDDVNILMWHYSDPQGDIHGPFSLKSLKGWNDAGYFLPDFRVWKTGQSKGNAEFLTDILCRMFPNC